MKIAYLILAHDDPGHLARLIASLREEWTEFFVHIDKKSEISPFRSITCTPRTTLVEKRIDVCWGGFSLVQAALDLVSIAAASRPEPDWYILLSGSDYPIRSNSIIRTFLSESRSEHISSQPMPGRDGRKSLSRLETFRFEGAFGHPKLRRVILHQTNRLLKRYHKRDYRLVLGDMVPYAGSQWWALSREAIAYIRNFIQSNSLYVSFYKHAHIPDEMFFHTILSNSPLAGRIARNLTYADWSQGITRHPAALTEKHVARFAMPDFQLDNAEGIGPGFFARKFSSKDKNLLDRVDEIRRTAESDFRWPMHGPRDFSGIPPCASSGKAS